ncbi:MAG: hypothetical protein EOO05_09845 [Chitinophagaceae bacterium]|nr:MAG: hypothetical protein EOO05_09845 [Chitinophagaceae bacterium]
MKAGLKIKPIKLDGEWICDGHHRYLASLLADRQVQTTQSLRTSATTETDWKLIEFDEKDWENEQEILLHNQRDAEIHNLTMAELLLLLEQKV